MLEPGAKNKPRNDPEARVEVVQSDRPEAVLGHGNTKDGRDCNNASSACSNFGTELGGRPEVVKSALSTLAAAVELLAATGIVLEQVERPAEQQMADNLESCKGIIAGRAVKSSHAVLLAILTDTESLGCRRHWLRRLGVGWCACGVCSARTARRSRAPRGWKRTLPRCAKRILPHR